MLHFEHAMINSIETLKFAILLLTWLADFLTATFDASPTGDLASICDNTVP